MTLTLVTLTLMTLTLMTLTLVTLTVVALTVVTLILVVDRRSSPALYIVAHDSERDSVRRAARSHR